MLFFQPFAVVAVSLEETEYIAAELEGSIEVCVLLCGETEREVNVTLSTSDVTTKLSTGKGTSLIFATYRIEHSFRVGYVLRVRLFRGVA